MRIQVKRLPKGAKYDFKGVLGQKVYHTDRRRYEVFEKTSFGKKVVTIYSEPNK